MHRLAAILLLLCINIGDKVKHKCRFWISFVKNIDISYEMQNK